MGKAPEKPGGKMEGEGEKTGDLPGTWRTWSCLRLGPPVGLDTHQVVWVGGQDWQKHPLMRKGTVSQVPRSDP